MIEAFDNLRSGPAVSLACQALGVARASIYRVRRSRRSVVVRSTAPRPRPPLSLSRAERERPLVVLNSECFADMAPAAIDAMLVDLDVARTHSRPHVSDDNLYSESQVKTLKYRPEFPARFGSLEDARAHYQRFFHWYNHEHRHSGIGLVTLHAVHHGTAEALQAQRAQTLQLAYAARPLRFKGRAPQPPALPTAAWINPPKEITTTAKPDSCSPISLNRVSQSD